MEEMAKAEWRVVGEVFVFYGAGGTFTGEAFESYFSDLEQSGCKKYIGATGQGFFLTSADRARGKPFFDENEIPFATITDDRVVRGYVTAASWFGMNVKAFSWAKRAESTRWLELDRHTARQCLDALLDLRFKVESSLHGHKTG